MPRTTLLFCGDVMTGRGIDQALGRPGDPALHEPGVTDARHYLDLAEAAHGPVGWPLPPEAIWGDAIEELRRARPDAALANLETAVTGSDDWCRGKEVLYRMHPDNAACLAASGFNLLALANNHVLDWGRAGLLDTLAATARAGIATAGAGRDLAEARRPAIRGLPGGRRLIVFGMGTTDSGIPPDWRATTDAPGIDLVDLDDATAAVIAGRVEAARRPGDIVVVSIHWGSNWGHEVPPAHVQFAHRLVAHGVDVVHGHSSHHVRPIEVYRGRLILYGCGDFLDDYEGIRGAESFRPDLALMHVATLGDDGGIETLRMVPMRMVRFRLRRAAVADARWLAATLGRTSLAFGSRFEVTPGGELTLRHDDGGGRRVS